MAVDYTNVINERVQGCKTTYNAMVSIFSDLGVPGFIAQAVSALVAGLIAAGSILYVLVLLTFVSLGTTVAQFVLDTIKAIREDGAGDFAAVTGEAMGEFFGADTSNIDFSAGKTPQDAANRAKQLGDLLVSTMQNAIGDQPITDVSQGAAGAKALAGFGMNFATSNAFISMMLEVLSDERLSDFAKLGEDMTRVVGLSRLTHQALRPLVRNGIETPYDRAMRATYRPDLIAPAELVKAFLAGRIQESDCDRWLAEHGYSDTFVTELKAQHTPDLKAEEIDLLQALGAFDTTTSSGQLKAQGLPDSIAGWRMQVLEWKRLEKLRDRILAYVYDQIKQGYLPSLAMNDAVAKLKLPQDEADLWIAAVGYFENIPRKRLSQGEILFLYEAAQITLTDVQSWLVSEGYSYADQQFMLTFFELKAAAAASSRTGGAAAKAANLHKEHIAYVTDEITGLWGRSPTTAELSYWVTLLDNGQRTKHDFTTELKSLDTSGPAIPPA